MKIKSLIFVQNCWLITYYEHKYWQYSVLCLDGAFYTPDTLYLSSDEAYQEGIAAIKESMVEDSLL